MGKHKYYHSEWEFTFKDKDGNVVDHFVKKNALVDQGEWLLLSKFFLDLPADVPAGFYIRLCQDTLDEADILTTLTGEPTEHGYAAVAIERTRVGWPTFELHGGDWRLVSKQVTFTATGGEIGPVNTAFLATTSDNLGYLIAFVNFDVERTILDGGSLIVSLWVKLA